MLSVTYVGHTGQLSGAEIQLARMVPLLAQRITVQVVLAADGPLARVLGQAGVPVEVVAMPAEVEQVRRADLRGVPVAQAVAAARYARTLGRALRGTGCDLVHTTTLKSAFLGGVAARTAGLRCVWGINDLVDPSYLPTAAVAMVRAAARVVPCALVANSHATLAALRAPGLASTVAYPPAPAGWRADGLPWSFPWDLDAMPFTAAMVGRLAPWKGQHVFLRAFAAAFPDGPERALIVGGALFGEHLYAAELRALATELGVAERVHFIGQTNEVEALMRAADVVVHASTSPEPFGQVIVEAMAVGTAVVAADAGGPREIVTEGVNGLLCRPGDVDAYAAALRRLAGDPALRASLAAAATSELDRFDAEVIADGLVAFYHRVVA